MEECSDWCIRDASCQGACAEVTSETEVTCKLYKDNTKQDMSDDKYFFIEKTCLSCKWQSLTEMGLMIWPETKTCVSDDP